MKKIDRLIKKIDDAPLWLLIFPLLVLYFWYYIKLGPNSVFEIHDQLDERIVNNVFNARHLFDKTSVFPEMFDGGVPKTGMTISAITFLFYRWFRPFKAFMLEYLVAEICAFLGTYFCVKRFGKSSILATISGMAIMWMRFRPAYGLSVVGFPIAFYAFSDLFFKCKEEKQDKHPKKYVIQIIIDFALIVFYGCMTSLAWVGFAVVIILFVADVVLLVRSIIKRRWAKYMLFYIGSAILVITDVLMNFELFAQMVLGNGYISHRTDWGVDGYPFHQAWNIFMYGDGDVIFSMQAYFMIPIVILLIVYGLRYRKLNESEKRTWEIAISLFVSNVLFALIYGFFGTEFYTSMRASSHGLLRSFQLNRFYWLYPGTWYILAGLLFSLPVRYHGRYEEDDSNEKYSLLKKWPAIITWLIIMIAIIPAAWKTRQTGWWILNKSQYKNNMSVGLISWKDFYADDLMKEIDDYIGKDKSSYRVASLGLYPCVPQVYGFYTIDGYSDNYPIEYKYSFRKIIEKELDKSPSQKMYYDTWGSRVYLLTSHSPGNYGAKSENFVYETLELDTKAMYDMNCRYIFSAGEVKNAENLNLELMKIFEQEDSFYRIYLYRIKD